ncbi:phage tail tape measure protein [bacterium]|nr:phage tail tape measure protein [bacterium]
MPTSNKVEITFTSDDRDLIRSLQKQNEQYEKQIKKLEQIGSKSRRTSKEQQSGFQQMAASAAKAVVGYGAILGVINQVAAANQELIREAQEVATAYDDANRKLQVQAGLTGIQRDNAKDRIAAIATNLAVPTIQATSAATQLVSSGFSAEEATGPSLSNFLKVLVATNQSGQNVDPAALALSLSQFLAANNLSLTGNNVLQTGQQVQSLFKGTNLQLGDLTPLAKEAGAFSNFLSVPEQLASQAYLVKSFDAASSSVALRNITGRLATASSDPARLKALQQIGLGSEDVDFVGEGYFDVLDRIAGGVNAAPEQNRAGILKTIFGEADVAKVSSLLSGRQTLRDYVGLQGDTRQFNSDLQVATSGRNAASIRQQNRREQFVQQYNENDDLLLEELDALSRENGIDPFRRSLYRRVYSEGFGVLPSLRGIGVPQSVAAGIAYGGFTRGDVYEQARQRLRGAARGEAAQDGASFVNPQDDIQRRQDAAGVRTFFPSDTERFLREQKEATEQLKKIAENTKQKPSRQIKRNESP